MCSLQPDIARPMRIVPTEGDLKTAAARSSMGAVFTILALWQADLDIFEPLPASQIRAALSVAIADSRPDIVSLLLATSRVENIAVKTALKSGNTAILDAFLWNGWDMSEPLDPYGPSALGYVVHDRNLVSWFLAHGADPKAGFEYKTHLSKAAACGDLDVIETLLDHGGDVTRGDVLHFAAGRKRKPHASDIIKLFISLGADPNCLGYDGRPPLENFWGAIGSGTPLHTAVRESNWEAVKALLEHGAERDILDTVGNTAEMVAKEMGCADAGAILNFDTSTGLSPVPLSCRARQPLQWFEALVGHIFERATNTVRIRG